MSPTKHHDDFESWQAVISSVAVAAAGAPSAERPGGQPRMYLGPAGRAKCGLQRSAWELKSGLLGSSAQLDAQARAGPGASDLGWRPGSETCPLWGVLWLRRRRGWPGKKL